MRARGGLETVDADSLDAATGGGGACRYTEECKASQAAFNKAARLSELRGHALRRGRSVSGRFWNLPDGHLNALRQKCRDSKLPVA